MYSSAYNIPIKKEYGKILKQNPKENELKKYTPHNLFSFLQSFPRSSHSSPNLSSCVTIFLFRLSRYLMC